MSAAKKGRPKGRDYPVHLQVRLSEQQAAALDRLRGARTRSQAMRDLIAKAER